MNEITGSIAKGPGLSVYQERGRDPTQTTALRLRFSREMTKRFRHLRGLIRRAIVDEDVFGLKQITTQQTPGREAFDFTRSSEKVSAFMQWFRRQIQDGILEVTSIQQVGQSVDAAWSNLYIRQAYAKGVKRARTQLRQAGYNVPRIEETGGLQAAINVPAHADRLGLLYTRTFNDLKGITDAMDQHISRVLAQGIAEGLNPNQIADRLTATIRGGGGELGITDTLGRYIPAERRAKMLARTEVIRAHSHAQIQSFKNWGAEGVTAIVEFQTAGDNRVCTQCAGLQGSFFTLDEALAIIPVHVSCYDKETEVYTDQGWKYFKDLNGSEEFTTLDLKDNGVKTSKAKKIIKSAPKRMLHFKNNDIDLLVTDNHMMVVSDSVDSEYKLVAAKDLEDKDYFYFPTSLMAFKTVFDKKDIRESDYNDLVYCVELEEHNILLVRRNGKVVWCGNCRCAWLPVPKDFVERGLVSVN